MIPQFYSPHTSYYTDYAIRAFISQHFRSQKCTANNIPYSSPPEAKTILEWNEMRNKIYDFEKYTDFHRSNLPRLCVQAHYHYAVYAKLRQCSWFSSVKITFLVDGGP